MKRRNFIKFSTLSIFLFSKQTLVAKTISSNDLLLLDNVYKVLFPKTQQMPSAKEFGATKYLLENIDHKSFLDYDKNLIIQGSKDFSSSFPNFLNLSQIKQKELIYSIVNSNDYAQTWLSKLVYFGIEALFSDPIYGGNSNQIGWKSINHNIGYPRPKKRYGQKL